MARILITGGAGFIGSHLAANVLRAGDSVVVLDNFEFVDSRQESSGAGKPYESPKDSPAVETATSPEPETPPSPEPETPPVSPANDPDLEEDVPF